MSPSDMLLVVTHTVSFLTGVVITRWVCVRNLRVQEIDGHAAIMVKPHDHHPRPHGDDDQAA